MTDLVWVVSSCVMILAVIAIRAIFGKKMSAGLRYALWALVAVRLLIPGTLFESPVSVKAAVMQTEVAENMEAVKDFASVERSGENEAIARPRYTSPKPAAPANTGTVTETNPGTNNGNNAGETAETKPANTAEQVTVIKNVTPERVETYQKTIKARDVLNVVWYTGMALIAVYLIYVNLRFYLKLRDRRKLISADAPCKVYAVAGLESSCLLFNTVYVSQETADDADELNCVLAHELSHRRHGDGFINLLRSAALILHWYNPLVWYAAFASRQDSELFADAGAVKTLGESRRENYGMTLIELSTKPSVRASIACTATTMANNKRALKQRVKNVASRRRTTVLIAVIVLAVAALAAGCAFLGSAAAENKLITADEDAVKTTPEPVETPTQTPDDTEPTDEWFYDEAWKIAEEIVKLYDLDPMDLNRDSIRRIERNWADQNGKNVGDYTDVVFGDANADEPYVRVRFVRDLDGETGWKTDKFRFGVTGREDYEQIAADRRSFDSIFAGHHVSQMDPRYIFSITPENLQAAGYQLKGDESDNKTVARYMLNEVAKKLTSLNTGNLLYCRDAQPGGLSLNEIYEDGVQCYKYDCCIAVLPQDPRSFELGFANAIMEWLYTGSEKPECRCYMQLYTEITVFKSSDGHFGMYLRIPGNGYDDPTPDPLPPQAEPIMLGGDHTVTFNYVDQRIFADFELPAGYGIRTDSGDATALPLLVGNTDGAYIYNANGELVGAFTAYPYDTEAPEDNLDWIYAEFRMGRWHIMIEDMYEPVAAHGTVHPALTLAEAPYMIEGQTMAGTATFTCDAVIAFDTASHTKIELAFIRDELTRSQLTAIAGSIMLDADDGNTQTAEPTEEWFIEEAWKLVSRIEVVHNQQYDKAAATVLGLSTNNITVHFPSLNIPGQECTVFMEKGERGNFEIWASLPETTDDEAGAAYLEWLYDEAKCGEKMVELMNMQLTVTESDVRASGCTAAIGTDEYRDAVANCYMQKLVELYTNDFNHLSPFRCYEVRGIKCVKEEWPYSDGSYTIVIAFRAEDPLALVSLFDYVPEFVVNTKYSMDLYGWLSGWTMVDIDVAADGSWTGSGMLNGAG